MLKHAPNGRDGTLSRRPFADCSESGGQDTSTMKTKLSVSRILVLGAIEYGPRTNAPGDIVRYLVKEAGFGPMEVSNMYRLIREFEESGYAKKDDSGNFILTELGKRFCPYKGQFDAMVKASKTLKTIKEAIEKR